MASATEQYFNVPSGEYESASSWTNGVVPMNGDNAYIGWAYGGTSAATLSSAVPNVAYLYLGSAEYASGQLDLLNGASLSGGSARIGAAYGATGTLTIADGASFTATSGYFCIGRSGGTGIVTQTGGNVTTTGWDGGNGEKGYTYIGASGTGTYHISGGTFACDYQLLAASSAGSSGTLIQDGGLFKVTGDYSGFSLGYAGTATYEMNGGSLYSVNGITAGGQTGSAGTINQTGGTISAGSLIGIGNSGTGAYNMSGGVLTASTMRVATWSSGTVHQTDGTVNATAEMQFAFCAGSTGVYNLDNGTLNAGSINVGMAGTGTLNVSGGVVNASGIMAGSGVTVNVGTPRYGSGAVYQTGGEVNLQGDLVIRGYTNSTGSYTFDNGALNVGGNVSGLGSLSFNGGTLHCGGTISTNASLGANPVFHQGNVDVCVATGVLSDASGVAGSLTKIGAGWLILNGANTYTGKTTVQAGVLQMNAAAYATVLAHTADVQGGQLLFNYTDTTTPVAAIRSSLHSGAMYTSTGAAQGCGVGYSDDGVGLVTAKVALLGDTDMGGIVNNDDLARL
ncbi:MAG: autotransporter-associated beta strand repeat-containing protein, partial [Thermoguttaceae bacterium]